MLDWALRVPPPSAAWGCGRMANCTPPNEFGGGTLRGEMGQDKLRRSDETETVLRFERYILCVSGKLLGYRFLAWFVWRPTY